MIKILVNGAFGHMGRLSVAMLQQHSDFQVVAQCGRQDDLSQNIAHHRPDVVLDLTCSDAVETNLRLIVDHGCRPVIGTSGLSQEKVFAFQQQCRLQQIGGIVAPNFSLAAVLMMRCAAMAAPYFESVEIIETHHPGKRDAPSGTAMKTAELIHQHGQLPKLSGHLPPARGQTHADIQIHSLRMTGMLAKQQVLFSQAGESLTIECDTKDRQAFMPGVLFCCRKVMELSELVYGLEHLLC